MESGGSAAGDETAEVPMVQVQPTGKERKISRGQFTTVWELTLDGKTVYAAKRVRDSVLHHSSPDWVLCLEEGLRRECRLLRQLTHPNIIMAVGITLGDGPALVTELMEDGNLDDYIAKRCRGKVDEQLKHMVLLDVARGLEYIHCKGIIHYSLTSRKILLTFKRLDIPVLAKIGGFGAAVSERRRPHFVLAEEEGDDRCPSESTLATYAPEVFSGFLSSQEASSADIFSFGVIMLQTLTQDTPLPLPLINEYGGVVPEVERHRKYLDILDDEHPLKLTVIECLSNEPQYRPTAEGILGVIEKAELRTLIPVGEVKELAEHHRQALSRLRLEKNHFCNERDRLRQRVDELSNELAELQRRLELSEVQVTRQARELTTLREAQNRRQLLERSQSLPEQTIAQQLQQHALEAPAVKTVVATIYRSEVQILEEVGRGAWAAVARGKYRQSTVAVKWPHEQLMRDYPDILPRLEREIGIMAQVRHPNLVHFIGGVVDENAQQLKEPPLSC